MMPPHYMHGPYGGMPPELYQFPNPHIENASQPVPSRFEQYPYQQPHYSAPHHMQALPEFVAPGRGDHLPHRVPHVPQFVMAPPWAVPIPFYFALPDVSNSVSKDGQKKPPGDSKEEGKKDSGAEVPKDAKAKKDDSKKTPILLSCLCPPVAGGGPTLICDLRDYPRQATLVSPDSPENPMQLNSHLRGAPITNLSPKSIILISRAFPWLIEVKNNSGVTLNDILNELHDCLSKVVLDTEYWAVSPEMRAHLGQAFRVNCDNSPSTTYPYGPQPVGPSLSKLRSKEDGLLRMDWLLNRHILIGLEKDDEFIALRVGEKKLHTDTWVLTLAPHRSFS